MNLIEKYSKAPECSEYNKQSIDKLNKEQKNHLEKLLEKMENSGATRPLDWALSEITENIPQFGRFLMLKGLYDIINDVEENMGLADDIDESYENDIFEVAEQLKETIGEEGLNNFLKSYAKGIMWQVTNLIDEGNYNSNGEPNWALKELANENDNKSERFINGLHESFNEFEEELRDPR